MNFEVAILGGGLAGWALQHALQAAGLPPEQILLLDKHLPASGSSGVPRGMMHPFTGRTLYPRPGYLEAWRYSQSWFTQLQQASGLDLLQALPLWCVALESRSVKQFERSFERARNSLPDYPVTQISDPEQLPLQGIQAAYLLESALQIDLPQTLAWLATHTGITQVYNTGPIQLHRPSQSQWQIEAAGRSYLARQLVLAPGQGLRSWFPHLPGSYKRGEVALFRLPQPLPAMVSGGGRYVAPIRQDLHITGATFYHAERAWPVTQSWQDLQAKLSWLPGIEAAQPVQIWSGVRAIVEPDREPLVGPVPGLLNTWVMGAFSTRGLLQIPLAAERLAQHILFSAEQIPEQMQPKRLDLLAWQLAKLV